MARVQKFVAAVRRWPNTFACWLRQAYPEWAPRSGHVALVALCGQEGSPLEQGPRTAS